MSQKSQASIAPSLFLVGVSLATAFAACVPAPSAQGLGDARRRRGLEASQPFLVYHGRANQMGDLAQVARDYRVIAVEADPADEKFTASDLEVLRGDGRNLVLGILNVGFCDRDQSYWRRASEGLLPCVVNLKAQLGERAARPRQVWMDLENYDYQHLIGEYAAPRLVKAGVDGFLLDGMELLDHRPDDEEGPCDEDCFRGGLALIAALRKEFPDRVMLMQGGISTRVRLAQVSVSAAKSFPLVSFIDGIVAEGVYTPNYDADKEAELMAWKAMGITVEGRPFAVATQDYVKSCQDAGWVKTVMDASHSHGFSPAVGLSPVSRAPLCHWNVGP